MGVNNVFTRILDKQKKGEYETVIEYRRADRKVNRK